MLVWARRLVPLIVLTTCAVTAVSAVGQTHSGPLTGTWSGYLTGGGTPRQHIVIVVNANESGGSWKLGATCRGPLTLDSISNGYHHYLRKVAQGSTCSGGDIDCLKRAGPDLYDAVTSHLGGAWDQSGTLSRVRSS